MNAKDALLVALAVTADLASVLAEELSGPEKNFEFLWKTFDRGYGNFGPTQVDWHLLSKVYRPRVTSATTDEELFAIMSDLKGKAESRAAGVFHFGLLKNSIGCFHFDRFRDPGDSRDAIDEIIRVFKDAKGLVVDVRGNGRGSDQVGTRCPSTCLSTTEGSAGKGSV